MTILSTLRVYAALQLRRRRDGRLWVDLDCPLVGAMPSLWEAALRRQHGPDRAGQVVVSYDPESGAIALFDGINDQGNELGLPWCEVHAAVQQIDRVRLLAVIEVWMNESTVAPVEMTAHE